MTFTTASGLLPAGMPFTSSGSRTEFAWKYDIKLGCKALRLKVEQADPIDNVEFGKLAVVKASNQKKALADSQGEPRRASADSSTSTASWRLWRAATVSTSSLTPSRGPS